MKIRKSIILISFVLISIMFVNTGFAQACIDNDGDSFGDIVTNETPCIDQPPCICADCNDNDASINPVAPEGCDGLDTNCDGLLGVDEEDNDGDTFMVCNGDCNDNDASINPIAPELCDGLDNNCDGEIDEGVKNNCTDYTTCITYLTCDSCPTTPAEICDDNIDNDCDTLTDCSDPECSTDPACSTPTCSEKEETCIESEDCCEDLKCKIQEDSKRDNDNEPQKICCEKNECSTADGCKEQNECITTDKEKVCAHGTWIPAKEAEQNCNDGIDNDCDGTIDCDDDDCDRMPQCGKIRECNKRSDCGTEELCFRHKCIERESVQERKELIKENARILMDEAAENIVNKGFQNKDQQDRQKIIRHVRKLRDAKVAYFNNEYEKSEAIATEIITGNEVTEQPKESKRRSFFSKIKSFFTR